MASTIHPRQGPLDHRGLGARAGDGVDGAQLVLSERRFLARVNVRGRIDHDAAEQAIGVALPREAGAVNEGNNLAALWLGPDEWLVVGPLEAENAVEECLVRALAGASGGVTDVTEGRTTIRVSGPMAADVLSMGCPLDLHPRVFGAKRCAQSTLGRTSILLCRVDDGADDGANAGAVFDLHVERSQADYLWSWLETAGGPYGVAVAPEEAMPAWRRPRRRARPDA